MSAVVNKPTFQDSVNNVTVIAGRDAVLSCSVDNLHNFKVSSKIQIAGTYIYLYICVGHGQREGLDRSLSSS